MSNVDHAEIAKFEALAHRWWDRESEFKPLHDINPLRVNWIDERVSLAGKKVLDVGCGGGILAESMAELGADAEQLHREVARYAAERGIEILWCVGPHALAQVETFWRSSQSVRAKAFAHNAALIAELTSVAPAAVLVKGSRSASTETSVAALCGTSLEGAH